jgi:hypothetical protein
VIGRDTIYIQDNKDMMRTILLIVVVVSRVMEREMNGWDESISKGGSAARERNRIAKLLNAEFRVAGRGIQVPQSGNIATVRIRLDRSFDFPRIDSVSEWLGGVGESKHPLSVKWNISQNGESINSSNRAEHA